jgi:iron complex outermembrane recepter protein
MLKRTTLVLLAAALCLTVSAQQKTYLFGLVQNGAGPLAYANVLLLSPADSALVKAEYTDDDGAFQMQDIPAGEYRLRVTHVGMPDYHSEVFALAEGASLSLPPIVMAESVELAAVVVTGRKPLIEVSADKTVFNVDASITAAGSDGLELLRKAPGVMLDHNENIQIRGKNGVQVYLDGKQSFLSPAELANLLRSLNAADIEAIEVITNPSAKYDAAGNAGIINIVLKKNKGLGTNGSVNLSGAYGLTPKANASVNLNHRNKNFNAFGNFGSGFNQHENGLQLLRTQDGKVFDQDQVQLSERLPLNAKAGLDYFLRPKHTIGLAANVNTLWRDGVWDSESRTLIGQPGAAQVDSVLVAGNRMAGGRLNANVNLNYRFNDDQTGRSLSLDADRGFFRATAFSQQPNAYFNGSETELLERRDFQINSPTRINITSFKADYEQRLWPGARLGAGLKSTLVGTDNTFDLFMLSDGIPVRDIAQSNQFDYDELVNAAYANLNAPLGKKLSLQAGLRLEQTRSTGDLQRDPALPAREGDLVKRVYTDLFPSAAITWQLHEKHALNATYSRRIDRPSYEDLNPFEWRLDELTFRKGNPFLRPQYANAFELKYIAFQMVNLSAGYTRTTDLIADIVEQDLDNPDRSFINYRNLASQDNYNIGLSTPTPIKPWWNGYVNLTVYKAIFRADFPEYSFEAATPVAVNLYAEQTFTLAPGLSFEMSGWYNSASIWGGSWLTRPQGSFDLGLQKKVLDGDGTLKLSFTDIFHTAPWSSFSDAIPGFTIRASGYWESQQLRVNFNYRFGNKNVKNVQQRRSGIDAESQRIKG